MKSNVGHCRLGRVLRIGALGVVLLPLFGCTAFVRHRVNSRYPPVTALDAQLAAVRASQAGLAAAGGKTDVAGFLTRDFLTAWLERALALPILPDDPATNPQAIQSDTSIIGATVSLGVQTISAAAEVKTTLCPDRKWGPPPARACADPIRLTALVELHLSPYLVPATSSRPAVLAFRTHVGRLQLVALDVSQSRWARINALVRWQLLLASLNGGLDAFRDNLSGLIHPELEVKWVMKVDPAKFVEEAPNDPTKDPFRVIVTAATGKVVEADVRVSGGGIVVSPDGLILLGSVERTSPAPCSSCAPVPVLTQSSPEALSREFAALLGQATTELNSVINPPNQAESAIGVRKDLVAALISRHAGSLDWNLAVSKRISSIEPDALCTVTNTSTGQSEKRPCPPLPLRLELSNAAFHCDDICNERECKIDCSARERCTPWFLDLAGRFAPNTSAVTCPKALVEKTEEIAEQVCEKLCEFAGPLSQFCKDVNCTLKTRIVKTVTEVVDPACQEASKILANPASVFNLSEDKALELARLFKVEPQYKEFCSRLNTIAEKPLCEAFKPASVPACHFAENTLNLLIGAARNKLGELEYRYAGQATGTIAVSQLAVTPTLTSGTLSASTRATASLDGHVKFVPEMLVALSACTRLETDLNGIQLSGSIAEKNVGATFRFGQKDNQSGWFIQPQGIRVEVATAEHPLLMLLKASPTALLTCPALIPIAQNAPLYELARTVLAGAPGPFEGVFSREVQPGELFSALGDEMEYLPEVKNASGVVLKSAEKVAVSYTETPLAVLLKPAKIEHIPGVPLPRLRRVTLSSVLGAGVAFSDTRASSATAVLAGLDLRSSESKFGAVAAFTPSAEDIAALVLGASYKFGDDGRWRAVAGARLANSRVRPFIGVSWTPDTFGFVW